MAARVNQTFLCGGRVAVRRASGKPALAAEPPRITILHSGFPNRTPIHLLIEALGKLGYENSRTAKIDLLGGEGDPIG